MIPAVTCVHRRKISSFTNQFSGSLGRPSEAEAIGASRRECTSSVNVPPDQFAGSATTLAECVERSQISVGGQSKEREQRFVLTCTGASGTMRGKCGPFRFAWR